MEFNWNDPNLDWKDPKVIEHWEYRDDGRCWGCGHLKGQEHAEMCDVERCKDCGSQMICCMCAKTEVCIPENKHQIVFKFPFQEKISLNLHNCGIDDYCCRQHDDGKLYFHWRYEFGSIKFCPFCGFEAKNGI